MKRVFALFACLFLVAAFSSQAQTHRQIDRSRMQQLNQQRIQQASTTATQSSATTNDAARRKAINDLFAREDIRQKDNAKALTIGLPKEATTDPVIFVGNQAMILEKERHTVEDASKSFFATNYDNIYPGAIVWADANLANGDPTLAFTGGKVDLRVNFNTGGKSSVANVNNNANAIHDAFFNLINQANYNPSPDFSYKEVVSTSVSEMAVGLKANANFLKVDVGIQLNTSSKEQRVYKVQDYTQAYYTVYSTQNPNDKSQYFGDNVTAAQIEKAMKAANGAPLAVITSVTYGRRAYKFYEYSSKSFTLKADEDVKAYGQSVSSTQDIANSSEEKNTWMYMSGGDANSSSLVLEGNTDINTAISKNLKFDRTTNQGIPISYTVKFLNTGNTCTVKTTGEYYTYTYKEVPGHLKVTLRNNCTHVAGAGLKIRLDYKCIYFDKSGKKHYVDPQNGCYAGFQRWVEYEPGFGDKVEFDLGPWPSSLPNQQGGYFIEGPLHLQVRCKNCSTCDWWNSVTGLVAPVNGIIDLDVHGAVRSGGTAPYIYSKSYTQTF